MQRPTILFVLSTLLATTACGTPTARAMQVSPSPTSYWSFLWQLRTPVETATLPAASTSTRPAESSPTPPSTAPLTLWPSPTADSAALARATDAPHPTATTTVANLRATVSVGLLSCRYGPGPEYLYLYALREGANITLIGRTDGDNWHWAWVEGRNRCWVNTSYLSVHGDWRQLPVVYPGLARLPVSPYYAPASIVSVIRRGNSVTVEWSSVPLRAGDEEDEYMQHYVLETWHCQGGRFIFEPLATNNTFITVVDEPGCPSTSHARLFVQEKHGFSGPTEVPWPLWQ